MKYFFFPFLVAAIIFIVGSFVKDMIQTAENYRQSKIEYDKVTEEFNKEAREMRERFKSHEKEN